jgi:diguanylate cyclase (GGDEF)-like protein
MGEGRNERFSATENIGKSGNQLHSEAFDLLKQNRPSKLSSEGFYGTQTASEFLPALETFDFGGQAKQAGGTKKNQPENQPIESSYTQLLDRLAKIDDSRQIETDQESRLKKGIAAGEKELANFGLIDGLLNKPERSKQELQHKQEELKELRSDRFAAEKTMSEAAPAVEQLKQLLRREQEQREQGQTKQADATKLQAEQQINTLMAQTEGVSFISKDTLLHAQEHRQSEIDAQEKFQNQLQTTKVVADTVRDSAIGGAAVIATGGVLAPMVAEYGLVTGTAAAVSAGATAGLGVSTFSRAEEAASDMNANNKSANQALTEALHNINQDSKSALITAASAAAGLNAASKFTSSIGLEGSQIANVTGAGAISGGVESTVSNSINTADRYQQAKKEFDTNFASLGSAEKEEAWEKFKEQNHLSAAEISAKLALDTASGIAAGAVGGRTTLAQNSAGQLTKLAVSSADVAADAGITVASAYGQAAIEGRQTTAQDLSAAATNVFTGRMIGAVAANHSASGNEQTSKTKDITENSGQSKDLYYHTADTVSQPRLDSGKIAISDQVPRIHERQKLNELRQAVVTDHVSGLHNQKGTYEGIDAGLAKAVKEGTPYSVIGIDANGLKEFNDTYGHTTGDKALKAVGDYLDRRFVRSTDIKGRLHGDEYLVGVRNTPEQLKAIEQEMKDVRLAVELKRGADGSFAKDHEDKPIVANVRVVKPGDTIRPDETIVLNSGISAGIAELTPEMRQLAPSAQREALEKQADVRMYETKLAKREENAKFQEAIENKGLDLDQELRQRFTNVAATEFTLSPESKGVVDRIKDGAGRIREGIPVELARPIYARRLEDEATKVPETGLLKKWAADQRSEHLLQVAAKEGKPVTVMSMDLDGLKNINDKYGHAAGSEMINSFGKWLKDRSRQGDVASQPYGADEFELTAYNATPEQLTAFRNQLDSLRFAGKISTGENSQVSASGIRVLKPGDELKAGESVLPYTGVSTGVAQVSPELLGNAKEAYSTTQRIADANVLKDKERREKEGKRVPRGQSGPAEVVE